MTHFSLTRGNRKLLASIPVLACLGLAFVGCGNSSSSSSGGDDDDSSSQGGGGAETGGSSGQGGGAQGGTGGDTGGAGSDPGGTGGVDPGGGAGGAGVGGTGVGGTRTGGTTGSGGEGGASGTAGGAGMAGAGGAGSDSCVNVSGGGVEPWYELTLFGTEFDADEGERMRVAVASGDTYRVGIADLPIVDGGFALSMPEVLNAGLYVGITLYIDRNENDTCEDDEHVWNWTTRAVPGDMRLDVTPDQLCDSAATGCRPNNSPLVCFVGAGDTDLREPLPCNP